MERISRLTRKVLVGKNLDRAAQAALICHEAEKIFNKNFEKDFLKELKIVSFRDGCLYLNTPGSAYSQEVKLKEGNILKEINDVFNNKVVNRIHFKN